MKTIKQIHDQMRFTTLIVTMLLMICIMWWNRFTIGSWITITMIISWFAVYLHTRDILCDIINERDFFEREFRYDKCEGK